MNIGPKIRLIIEILAVFTLFGVGYKTFVQRTDQTIVQKGGQSITYEVKPALGGCAYLKNYGRIPDGAEKKR